MITTYVTLSVSASVVSWSFPWGIRSVRL